MRTLALGGAVGPVLFAIAVILCAALRPEYDHARQVMSVLGETGGEYATLMNALGFVPNGTLLAGFGASLLWLVPRTPGSILGGILVGLFGIGVASAGIFSCDAGCPREGISAQATLHLRVSIVAFLSGVASCAVWALVFRRSEAWKPVWIYSAVSALVSFVLLLVFNDSAQSGEFKGVWQRLFLATLYLWCAVVGIYTFRFAPERRRAA